MIDCEPEIVKEVNDAIIVERVKGCEIPLGIPDYVEEATENRIQITFS